MISPTSRGAAALFVFAFSTGAAQADVSAADIWADWRAYLEGTGYAVTGTESTSGATLTVSDTVMTFDVPEDDVSIELRMGDLDFTENGDGTVNIAFPQDMPIVIGGKTEDGEDFEIIVTYTQSGFTMVASGDPDDITYNYTASSLAFGLDQAKVSGLLLTEEIAEFQVDIANVLGSTRMQGTDIRTYTQTQQTGAVTYTMRFAAPDGSGQFAWAGNIDSLTGEGVSVLPGEIDVENMAANIANGMDINAKVTLGPGSSNLNFQDAGESFSYESQSQGGAFGVALGADGIGYDIQQNQIAMNMAGSELPIPISLNAAEMVFKVLIPIVKSDDDQDFALTIDMSDFTMSDLIWGIFDPTGQLPRDPATLTVALEGKAKLLADIMDPMVAMQMENGPPPAELNALTVTELEVTAAGASLTGAGDFTFDNSDLETFNGMPRPTGALDLKLVGGNGLLDKLVAMGLVPGDQAGGVRMMMGLFSVPGDAPDTLNSKIEINDQGHILANGQRIQ